MNDWIVIDKLGDISYFKDHQEIADALHLTKPQIYAIYTYSLININKPSPSRGYYIQRLFNNIHSSPRDYTKIKYNWFALKNIYPNIIN